MSRRRKQKQERKEQEGGFDRNAYIESTVDMLNRHNGEPIFPARFSKEGIKESMYNQLLKPLWQQLYKYANPPAKGALTTKEQKKERAALLKDREGERKDILKEIEGQTKFYSLNDIKRSYKAYANYREDYETTRRIMPPNEGPIKMLSGYPAGGRIKLKY